MIEINKDKCINCMKCASVCPFTVIVDKDGEATALNKFCLDCYHCGAVCPVDAITFDGKKVAKKMPEDFDEKYNVNLKELIMKRRSYRHFDERPVEDGVIAEALEIVKWAPSAKNEHPTRWKVISDKNVIDEAMALIISTLEETGKSKEVVSELENGNNVVFAEAPTVLVAYSDGRYVDAISDGRIEATTVELILQSQGVGTCWGGYLRRFCASVPGLKALIGLPETAEVQAVLLAGYPKNEVYIRLPIR